MQDPGAGDEGLYLGQEAVNAGGLLQGRVWQPQAKTKKQEVLEGEIKANSGQLKVNILGQVCKSHVASIAVGATVRQEAYLISLISIDGSVAL